MVIILCFKSLEYLQKNFRPMKKAAIYISIFFLLLSCSRNNQDVIEISSKRQSLNILILGNSVLRHPPSASLGWYGDWGMAATAPEKDFLHLYSNILKTNSKFVDVQITSQNISTWETSMQLNQNILEELNGHHFDLIIIRLGENVGFNINYSSELQALINKFRNGNTKVIITGTIWKNNFVENTHKSIAAKENYNFVSFDKFRSNSSNFSFGRFQNTAVAAHPSDQGMNEIANLLVEATLEMEY